MTTSAHTASRCRASDYCLAQPLPHSVRSLLGLTALAVMLALGAIRSLTAAEPVAAVTAPADGARDVPVNVTLTWAPVADAKGYDVYFSANATPAFQCRVEKPTFLLETLSVGTTYRWRVDPVSESAAKPGPEGAGDKGAKYHL